MAGKGPPPKNPATRRRRNKASTSTVLRMPARPGPAAAAPPPAAAPAVQTSATPGDVEALFVAARLASFTEGGTPPLPTHRLAPRVEWHHRTRAFWADVWASPMAGNYLRADIHGLYLLASLVDDYWHTGDPGLATEIRLQRQAFGLTPIDRWRLQWTIAPERPARKPAAASPQGDPGPPAAPPPDPRKVLSMAKR